LADFDIGHHSIFDVESAMKITILMTVYNTAKFLPEAIESVLRQTVRDFEFLIIDDGSTDGSLEILEKYAAEDKRIRLIAQKNTGCSQAWNYGFTLTDSDWIFRFDSDDVMYPQRLERQVAFIESHPGVKVVSCIVDYIDEHGVKIMTSKPVLMTKRDWQHYYSKCRPVVIPHTGAALHRQTVLEMGGYNYDFFSDTYLFSRMMEAGHMIMLQPEILGGYRVHSSSIMSRNVFWGEVGAEWIHDNWQRRRSGQPEIDWATYQNSWRGWRAWLRPNRLRLLRARIYMREIVRLMRSRNRWGLSKNLCGLCLTAPDYLAGRLLRRYAFFYRGT
jgi:glycosyltransferase involved in cell wall biosynthesis